MIATHLTHSLLPDAKLKVWSIDTMLSADGWREYVSAVADESGWDHAIFSNETGFAQFVQTVKEKGCPRTRTMHTYVYQKLKERAIDALHMMYKKTRNDKTLFVSGMRRAESKYRQNADEVARVGKSNKIFVAPIVYWSDEHCAQYRIDNDLPDNPFYGTVKGSGDCQCNWGNFITMGTLQLYSPKLAAGNVAMLDQISRDLHGYGWDGSPNMEPLFPISAPEEPQMTTPFLCAGCKRKHERTEAQEYVMMQRGLF